MRDPILYLKRADLPPRVRTYIDNLNAQVQHLLKAHDAKNMDDFKRLIKEKKVRVEVVENLNKLLSAYAKAVRTGERPPEDLEFTEDYENPETGETREIRLDLNEALKTTSEFFRQFGLDELRAALPKSIHLTDDQKEIVRKKMREGFDLAFVLPPPDVFEAALEHVAEAMTKVITNNSRGFEIMDYKNYQPTRKKFTQSDFRGRRPDHDDPYILLIKNRRGSEVVEGTRKDIVFTRRLRDELNSRSETGLNFGEYIIFHRWFVEKRKGAHPDESLGTILLDSDMGSDSVLSAEWVYNREEGEYLGIRQVTATSEDARVGRCRTAVVIPLR